VCAGRARNIVQSATGVLGPHGGSLWPSALHWNKRKCADPDHECEHERQQEYAAGRAAAFHATKQRDIAATGPIGLDIETTGFIRASHWVGASPPRAVAVRAMVRATTQARADAAELEATFSAAENAVKVRVNWPGGVRHDTEGADVQVLCAVATEKVRLFGQDGLVYSNGLGGECYARTTLGDIRIGNHDGPVSARSVRGDIFVLGTHGDVRGTCAHGRIVVHDTQGSVTATATWSGSVQVTTVQSSVTAAAGSGSISIDGVGDAVMASTTSGGIKVFGVKGACTADATSGDIEVMAAGAMVNVSTTTGHIKVKGVVGACEATSPSGSIYVTAVRDWVSAMTITGDIHADIVGGQFVGRTCSGRVSGALLYGPVEVQTTAADGTAGHAHIELAPVAAGPVRIETVGGSATLHFGKGFAPGLATRTARGQVHVHCAPEYLQGNTLSSVRTEDGDVHIFGPNTGVVRSADKHLHPEDNVPASVCTQQPTPDDRVYVSSPKA